MGTFSVTQKGVEFSSVSEPQGRAKAVPYSSSMYEDASDLAASPKLLNAVDIDYNGVMLNDAMIIQSFSNFY